MTKRVAVVGAGISGVVTAAHLKKVGLDVTVFERNNEAGGVWVYDARRPVEPQFPAIKASKGEEYLFAESEDLVYAPPSPCYVGLKNNVATRLMKTSLSPWPQGTEDYVNHSIVKAYIQTVAKVSEVDKLTQYGSRVVDVKKVGDKWHLKYSTRRRDSVSGVTSRLQKELEFDSVVIASGHYHAPRVPDIPGLKEWRAVWPSRVWHSKAYREPEIFKGKNILLIGSGTSSTDIARELGPFANKIWQTSRGGTFDLPPSMLPENGTRIAGITSFEAPTAYYQNSTLEEEDFIPAKVTLASGDTLCNINIVIVCTGYQITLPFLSGLHEDETLPTDASDTVLVTDGSQVHNLHKDIFYIPDPSLIFVGIPYFTATFNLFEFQAITVAAVLSGVAEIPSESAMREEYRQRVEKKGYGKPFHSLRGVDEAYVNELLDWINEGALKKELPLYKGNDEEWHIAKAEQMERMKKLFGDLANPEKPDVPVFVSNCVAPTGGDFESYRSFQYI